MEEVDPLDVDVPNFEERGSEREARGGKTGAKNG